MALGAVVGIRMMMTMMICSYNVQDASSRQAYMFISHTTSHGWLARGRACCSRQMVIKARSSLSIRPGMSLARWLHLFMPSFSP